MSLPELPVNIPVPELIDHFRQFVTEERYRKFISIAALRTCHLAIGLEDIYQPHNASAVLRTCDCFGIQTVHIIENRNKFQVNPDVALGASKWLNLVTYSGTENNTAACISSLKEKGYRVVATTPHEKCHTPETLPLGQRTALLFGTEMTGLSSLALDMADDFVMIPMFGFTESFNISVSAAIFMMTLTSRLRSSDIPWELPAAEQELLVLQWMMHTVKNPGAILRAYRQGKPG